jgi:hypothetical protein
MLHVAFDIVHQIRQSWNGINVWSMRTETSLFVSNFGPPVKRQTLCSGGFITVVYINPGEETHARIAQYRMSRWCSEKSRDLAQRG